MNKRLKDEWVAALRSREYKQSQGALKKDDGFCCLGVLADIQRKKKKRWKLDDAELQDDFHVGHDTRLAKDLQGNYISTSLVQKHDQFELAEANDAGLSFDEIADKIVEMYESID